MYCTAGSFNGLIHIPDPRLSWSPISSASASDPTGWLEQSAWAFVVKARVGFDPYSGEIDSQAGVRWIALFLKAQTVFEFAQVSDLLLSYA